MPQLLTHWVTCLNTESLKTYYYRLIPGLVVCFVMLLSLTGCQKDTSGKAVIRFSTWGSAEEMAVVKSLINEFEANHPTVSVEMIHIPENYYQKLHLMIAGGNVPDVMFTNSISFPIYATHGIFADLTPWLEKSTALAAGDFFTPALEAFYWANQPDQTEILGALPRDVSNLVVFYNRTLFKKQGLALPTNTWDWQTFLIAAQRLTVDANNDGHPERFGVSFFRKPPLTWMPFVWSAGGQMLSEDRTQFTLTEPVALEGLTFYSDLRNRYHVAPRQIESGGATMSQLFLQQKLGMMISGRWSVPFLRQKATFDWDVAPFPSGQEGSKVGIDASGYAMASSTPHPEASWAFIEFMSSPKAMAKFTQSGLIVPARMDVAKSSAFLAENQLPAHSGVFLETIDSGVPTRSHPRWNELSEEVQLALDPVWDGQAEPGEALLAVQDKIQRILTVDDHPRLETKKAGRHE
ncbi:MAG: sugar ABC transporter substrate-binding protein [Vampirovibrio sp.]|nr:sugar ABC transporter substrate-binding protein [Vampirovibrio sp.]